MSTLGFKKMVFSAMLSLKQALKDHSIVYTTSHTCQNVTIQLEYNLKFENPADLYTVASHRSFFSESESSSDPALGERSFMALFVAERTNFMVLKRFIWGNCA